MISETVEQLAGNQSTGNSIVRDKGELMGRKGVSKRKPKQQKSSSNGKNNGNASTRSGGNAVAGLVKDKSAPLNTGNTNPSAGSNKKHKMGK